MTPTVINVPVPEAAQTTATRFRLWQDNFFASGNAWWALDDLFIGGYTKSNGSSLFEM